MTKLIASLAFLFLFSFIGSCQAPVEVEPPDTTPPGKRDYVWSIDSVDFGNRPGTIELQSMWGSSATDVWGADGDAPDSRDCLWHYDGVSWKRATEGTPITSGGGNKIVFAVWGSAKNDVWAVGRYRNGEIYRVFIMHYDGAKWSDATPTSLYNIGGPMYGLHGISKNEIYAYGHDHLLQYDGSKWQAHKAADSVIIASVTGTAGNLYLTTYDPWNRPNTKDSVYLLRMVDKNFYTVDKTHRDYPKFFGGLWKRKNQLVSFANGASVTTINADGSIDKGGWYKEIETWECCASVWIRNNKDMIGAGKSVLHYNGTDWQPIPINVLGHSLKDPRHFRSVWMDSSQVFICDSFNGIIYHGR